MRYSLLFLVIFGICSLAAGNETTVMDTCPAPSVIPVYSFDWHDWLLSIIIGISRELMRTILREIVCYAGHAIVEKIEEEIEEHEEKNGWSADFPA